MSKKIKQKEPAVFVIFKLIMIAFFMWSGFFWGIVTALGIQFGYIFGEDYLYIPKTVAWELLAGDAVLVVAIVIAFFRKYIISFALQIAGCVIYLKGASPIVSGLEQFFKDHTATDSSGRSLEALPKEYMLRHYPIAGVAVCGFILVVLKIIFGIIKRRKQKQKADNAPVKSIID